MPEPANSDYRALEEAEKLDGALYGTRLYSNTAVFALAQLREEYEAKLAAQRSRFGRRLARASVWRSWSGTVSVVAGLVLAVAGVAAMTTSRPAAPASSVALAPARIASASPVLDPHVTPSPAAPAQPERVASTAIGSSASARATPATKRAPIRTATTLRGPSHQRQAPSRYRMAASGTATVRGPSRASAAQRLAAAHSAFRRSPPADQYYRAYAYTPAGTSTPSAPPPVQLTSSGGIARPLYGEALRRALREDRRRTREVNQDELDDIPYAYRERDD